MLAPGRSRLVTCFLAFQRTYSSGSPKIFREKICENEKSGLADASAQNGLIPPTIKKLCISHWDPPHPMAEAQEAEHQSQEAAILQRAQRLPQRFLQDDMHDKGTTD